MKEQIFIHELALLPFLLMLMAIAIFPLFAEHFWEKNKNKLIVALSVSIPVIIYLVSNGLSAKLFETMVFDYVPFIILLGALFVITGGIYVEGDIESKPATNTSMLAIGAILASVMGTTGAAMLLIRPLLRTNHTRKFKVHTVLFFIGIVANCGGLLTPLGDPPLFMMYLRGVPFNWFFMLAPEWLFANGLLLIIYYFVDSYFWKQESDEVKYVERTVIIPISITGKINILLLAGVIAAVAFINGNSIEVLKQNHYYSFLREAVIALLAALSILLTNKITRESNQFSWTPIIEVAYLFLGIFITMVPCLLYLEINAHKLGVSSPMMFYFASGALSSFLDNTPTAVTFYSLAQGLGIQSGAMVAGVPELFMKAICTGAVFFGSMTYIGNGPNFMVKAIAESQQIKMPHFFKYMYQFSLIVLLPIFILVYLIFI